jgi:hypothetical protein
MKDLYLKKVEGDSTFYKSTSHQGVRTVGGKDLKYTYCDLKHGKANPFGNLFVSLNIPVTEGQRATHKAIFKGTALEKLGEVNRFIVIEIPKDNYGEMIDGKTISLNYPTIDGVVEVVGNYFNHSSGANAQLSDTNPFSSNFGVEPTPDNDFNTNIAYLFSNYSATPKDTIKRVGITDSNISIASFEAKKEVKVRLEEGEKYEIKTGTNLLSATLTFKVSETQEMLNLKEAFSMSTNGVFTAKRTIESVVVNNTREESGYYTLNISNLEVSSTTKWDVWTKDNQFPIQENGFGKRVAKFEDQEDGALIDVPVGIAYLDKGLLIITDENLIDNIDTKKGIATSYIGAERFVSMRFPNLSSLSFDTVTSEFIQNITCLAMHNEYNQSNNPTFMDAYPDGGVDKPVYITEVPLYNKFGDMIAIAKLSSPMVKKDGTVALFNIKLKL